MRLKETGKNKRKVRGELMERSKNTAGSGHQQKAAKRVQSIIYLFMGPAILLFFIAVRHSVFGEIYYSFTNWNGIDQTYGMRVGDQQLLPDIFRTRILEIAWFTIRFSALFGIVFPT